MTMNTLTYRGYTASIELDACDGILWGKVLGLADSITFEGETVHELIEDFHNAIDFYLEDCLNMGRAPEKPLSGELLLHIAPEIHDAVLAAARAAGKSIDQWANELFANEIGANSTMVIFHSH